MFDNEYLFLLPSHPSSDNQVWLRIVLPCYAKVRLPETKTVGYIRLDDNILNWIKSQGKCYQGRINVIVPSYYEVHKNEPANHL